MSTDPADSTEQQGRKPQLNFQDEYEPLGEHAARLAPVRIKTTQPKPGNSGDAERRERNKQEDVANPQDHFSGNQDDASIGGR